MLIISVSGTLFHGVSCWLIEFCSFAFFTSDHFFCAICLFFYKRVRVCLFVRG